MAGLFVLVVAVFVSRWIGQASAAAKGKTFGPFTAKRRVEFYPRIEQAATNPYGRWRACYEGET